MKLLVLWLQANKLPIGGFLVFMGGFIKYNLSITSHDHWGLLGEFMIGFGAFLSGGGALKPDYQQQPKLELHQAIKKLEDARQDKIDTQDKQDAQDKQDKLLSKEVKETKDGL